MLYINPLPMARMAGLKNKNGQYLPNLEVKKPESMTEKTKVKTNGRSRMADRVAESPLAA